MMTSRPSRAPRSTRAVGSTTVIDVSPLAHHRTKLGFGHHIAFDLGLTAIPPHILTSAQQRHVKFDSVARHNRPTEFRLVDRHEINVWRWRAFWPGEHAKNAGGLCHAFNQQHAGENWIVGKVPEKLWLIERDVLDADAEFFTANID